MANEKRLISAEMAKEMIVNHANEFSDVLNRREKALLIGGGTSCIDKCPTVDAVEVVRCKDCVSVIGNEVKGYVCKNQLCPCWAREVTADFSCICGERRNDGK